ncbi:MAG TPA: EAL domain-containing protein [Stellaceae bacterium]|nr:EAL domain-containing protein [Stellaceae bacterium]
MMLVALIGIWIIAVALMIANREHALERAQVQLSMTVERLADFNGLAEKLGSAPFDAHAATRRAAIWRALLQYPTAFIWVESDGHISAGQQPKSGFGPFILAREHRGDFTVHAALPVADALRSWRHAARDQIGVLLAFSAALLLLTRVLMNALRQRAAAERSVAMAEERATQLALHRAQLEVTVAQRTAELRDANAQLETELVERKAAEEKIALLARTDALTGLANRATFIDRLGQAFAASNRGASPFAVLYLDLDHFKNINDTLGHPIGDLLLREVALRLKGTTREADLVARLGGDEFAILQTDMGEPANAGALAAKIQASLGRPFALGGNEMHIGVSIGICPFSSASAGPDAMLAQADLALYRAKDEARNQYRFHSDELDREVLTRITLADDLRRAIECDQLELYYQPQVELVSGKIVGMEALVRWHHPTRGLLHPPAFIPIAEKTGTILALGQWVLDRACRQLKIWRDEGVGPPIMSINLSLAQIRAGSGLVSDVAKSAAKWGLFPSDLEFDVTEAALAQATWSQSGVLAELRRLGAKIALDDFGTEYSSFEYLRAYRVNHLKIAQSFISEAVRDPDRAATIRAIISLAREFGIEVIAEGVETEEQRSLLVSTGSTGQAQGHYFSEAVVAARADELLRQGSIRPHSATAKEVADNG